MKTIDLFLLIGIVAAGVALVRLVKGNASPSTYMHTADPNPYTQYQDNGVTYL